ncbi:MAG TPA: thioredoxin-dependent thiol peroxidase [Stellaceae bacterium]
MTALKVGDKAPDFTLPSDGGGEVSLAKLKGKKVVLYFYPRDDTPGCTKEACNFRDAHQHFGKTDAVVIGISKDTVASHDKFKKKYELPFILGSDKELTAAKAYGVWVEKAFMGRKFMGVERATFLIDGKGVIRGIWHKVKIPGHDAEVLTAAKEI